MADTDGKTTGTPEAESQESESWEISIPSGSTEMGIPYSVLKNANNMYKTQSLFLEYNYHREIEDPSPFTLKPFDHKGKTSLKRLYMEVADVTEYEFAIMVFGDFQHWKKLSGSSFFKPHIEEWRDELEVKLRSQAIRKVQGSDSTTDAKWLAERGWTKGQNNRGRPTKAEKQREARRLAEIDKDLLDEGERIFGKPVH